MTMNLYEQARQSFANGEINWSSDVIKMLLVDTGLYTPNLLTNRYFSHIPTDAIVATATLAGKTATNGECKANDVVFQNVSGNTVESFVIYKDTGTEVMVTGSKTMPASSMGSSSPLRTFEYL